MTSGRAAAGTRFPAALSAAILIRSRPYGCHESMPSGGGQTEDYRHGTSLSIHSMRMRSL